MLKLGKHPARHDLRTLLLKDHILLPTPPDSVRWSNGQVDGWGYMLNNVLGDCTCAALGHAEQSISWATGAEVTVSDTVVQSLYSNACGYIVGDESTDNGGDELNVLNYVRKNGMLGVDQLIAYADPNPSDITHVKQTVAFMGGVYIGLMLPDSVVVNVDMLLVDWTDTSMPPNPNNGHAVWTLDYDANFLYCITWGRLKKMSWDFWLKYCDESHALLTQNWLKAYGNIKGLNIAAQSMLNALVN